MRGAVRDARVGKNRRDVRDRMQGNKVRGNKKRERERKV